jgi:ABC-type molybdate transport system substrate-binding protein
MTPDGVTVFCDPTLRAVVGRLGAQTAYEVAALCAPAPLMLAQITRHTRNDVLWTETGAMDQAVAQGLVVPGSRVDGFGNTLVLAARAGWKGSLATARTAVTDRTVVSGLDGRAVLAANHVATGPVQGVANTADVAFLVTTGAADVGLVYLTDVKADARLQVVRTLSFPVRYSAAVNAHAASANAGAFMALLKASGPVLQAGGLSWA